MTTISIYRPKLCFVVTEPCVVQWFLVAHLRALSERYEITLITNSKDKNFLKSLDVEGRSVTMPLVRDISLVWDIAALCKLSIFFRREGFDCVHSFTPKSGLLTAVAGAIARVPIRIHTFTGQVWSTKTGFMRWLLKSADKTVASLDTHLLADSPSQLVFMLTEGIVRAGKCYVLGNGSVGGVESERFRPDKHSRISVRKEHGISDSAVVFLFLGRLARDKGLHDLVRAFRMVSERLLDTFLWIVGPDEQGIKEELTALCEGDDPKLRFFGPTSTPERIMAAADVLFLPSYREGFGTVVIEAAAVGIPAVVSRIYGLTDAVEENFTGLFHQPRNPEEIAEQMLLLSTNHDLRRQLGSNARRRALNDFSKERITAELAEFYRKLLTGR